VIVSPGQTYVPPGVPTAHLRLSFSTATDAEADRGLARLALALRDAAAPAGRGRTFEDDGLTV
jgi:DNA-binding transcriptional MocR family regulator